MYLDSKTSQHRRDFRGIYKCEHCDLTVEGTGYDDLNFFQNVIPNMTCSNCGKIASKDTPQGTPDVPAHVVI